MQKIYQWESGDRYGRLMLTGKSYTDERHRRYVEAICSCDAHTIIWTRICSIINGRTSSCGCLRSEKTSKRFSKDFSGVGLPREPRGKYKNSGGVSRHPLYKIWAGMIRRCYVSKNKDFKNYGGRGISVCDEWRNSFNEFRDWAILNGWFLGCGLTLDRYPNNDGNYEPPNCRWAADAQQRRNKRTNVKILIFGEWRIMTDWGEDSRCNVSPTTFFARIKYGWDAEKALTTPLIKKSGYRRQPAT